MEEKNTDKREVCISYSIKLYPSDKERFKRLGSEMDGVTTDRGTLNALMDFFENPKKVVVDNPELIRRNEELSDENDELQETVATLKAELAKSQEEKAQRSNRPDNVFEIEVHPVAFHFLKQMASDLKVSPGYILTDLFIKDLQNPRANNLPYIVPSSEIRAKLEEYKKTHQEEYKKEA